jgi:hypothetical protein
VVFEDGSREQIDVVVWATGYDIRFPFFDDPALCADAENVNAAQTPMTASAWFQDMALS